MHHILPHVESPTIFHLVNFSVILREIHNFDPVSYAAVMREASDMIFHCFLSEAEVELVRNCWTYFYFLGFSEKHTCNRPNSYACCRSHCMVH
jgi:hypothetical protein